MPKLPAETIEKYQKILSQDPGSQVFAPLADSYREMGLLEEAEKIAQEGIKRHPKFVSGLVVLAKIYRDQKLAKKALPLLQQAVQLSSENILAQTLLAEAYLALRDPKEAIRAFKKVLFLNPKSDSAKMALQRLETLTADEYEEDLFEMTQLKSWTNTSEKSAAPTLERNETPKEKGPLPLARDLERALSLIDAFIVRNDLEKAQMLLSDCQDRYGHSPEIAKRLKTLGAKTGHLSLHSVEVPENLSPLPSQSTDLKMRKLESLQLMLRKIEEYRAQY